MTLQMLSNSKWSVVNVVYVHVVYKHIYAGTISCYPAMLFLYVCKSQMT